MSAGSELPNEIHEAINLIRSMQGKNFISRAERENLNRAKLRIAFWACRNENIVANRENLAYVLGPDAAEIMSAYDKYLQREDDKPSAGRGGKSDGKKSEFWGGA